MEQAQFLENVEEHFRKHEGDPAYVGEPDNIVWKRFSARLQFYCADVLDADQLLGLKEIKLSENARPLTIYLATPPSIFSGICESFNAVGLVSKNTRIVVEKPLGNKLNENFS